MTTCECIDALSGSYNLVCTDRCERCNEDAQVCGLTILTEVLDVSGTVQYIECLQFTEGSFEGEVLCMEEILDDFEMDMSCRISVNGVYCKTCVYEYKQCGLEQEEDFHLYAECDNVPEIGYVVDECTHNDEEGILSSFFAAYNHIGACNVNGTLTFTDNETTVDLPNGNGEGGDRTEGPCEEEASLYQETFPEYEMSCNCIEGSNATTTLNCIDGCESCDSSSKVCGISSFNDTFDEEYFLLQTRVCFEYTRGSLQGDIVCFEEALEDPYSFESFETTCRLNVNGVDCISCEFQEKACGGFDGSVWPRLVANCTNNEIGLVVDECDDDSFHELLAALYYNLSVIGSCEIGRDDNVTIPPLKPPSNETGSSSKPPANETGSTSPTSKACHEKAVLSLLIIAAAVLVTTLAWLV